MQSIKAAAAIQSTTSDSYLAKPSGPCCLKGFIHDGEPRGTISPIVGIETYVVHPHEGQANGNVILYFPDVWGLFTNGMLVMDSFAEAGYLVLGLDYFMGVSLFYFLLSSVFKGVVGMR